MEKKIKFSDKSTVQKIVYLTVIAILCVSAIVIGIIASNNRKEASGDNQPGTNEGTQNGGNVTPGENEGTGGNEGENEDNKPKELAFVSPAVGTVYKSHSATVPVFSNTLDEWRIHTGIDIGTKEGAEVVSAEAGEVTGVYRDAMLGYTVELTHSDTHKTYYSNLAADSVCVKIGDKVERGASLGCVGDSSVSELADEPHLHFELKINGTSVNPLDYISEDSKQASLGIDNAA